MGLTGAFGSGCTFIADEYFVKNHDFKKYSLSDILKEEFIAENGRTYNNRNELQEFGNKIRREKSKSYLAEKVYEKIKAEIDNPKTFILIDSFRNPYEIQFFRDNFTRFFLFAFFAEYSVRWERVNSKIKMSHDEFERDDNKDQGYNEPDYGQKVSDCFFEADVILSNNDSINITNPNDAYEDMKKKIDHYLFAFQNPAKAHPSIMETLMAMAYTFGRRSRCVKRKVGAIIVDKYNNLLSSGFNDVPKGIKECALLHGTCYRDIQRDKLREKFDQLICEFIDSNLKPDSDEYKKHTRSLTDEIVGKTKVLDLCRALHAEESAVLNLVSNSNLTDFSECSLYATTYPCNLCANKIVQVGIKNVVYFEPYPVQQAKKIFEQANVKATPFEGITFRAFFKAYNYQPN